MKIALSLRSRFILAVSVLLLILFSLIMFVIEQREVRAIYDEQKSRGFIVAQYLIQLSLDEFINYDPYGIEENIKNQIDDNLIYIVFYDSANRPYAANEFIKNHKSSYDYSHFQNKELQGEFFSEQKRVKDPDHDIDYRILEIEAPIFVEGSPRRWGSVKIGLSMEEANREIQDTRMRLILIGGMALIVGIVGSLFLARSITTPLKKLLDGTIRISKGDFAHKIDISTRDEIGNLADSFNDMSRQLLLTKERMDTANKKLLHAEKLASIGRISASIAHEIRNPLTSVKLNIQKISQSNCWGEIEKGHLEITQEGIGHIETFIKELLNFTRVPELNRNHFPIDQIIDGTIKMISDSMELKQIHLKIDIQEGLPTLFVDGDRMRQVFLNILRNASEAVNEGGEISLSAKLVEDGSEKKLRMEISDNGPGIPEKEWENIFEPFYSMKSSGFGLGLANAKKIVEQHNGSIRVIKKEGAGACFEIIIPYKGEK
ncbi:MAG: HAMP domain-containing protein [Candidatus Aminicenantes bacterium]|nr:HAMP domain-containing protein [Candidatus Aminicenantes bacterium]